MLQESPEQTLRRLKGESVAGTRRGSLVSKLRSLKPRNAAQTALAMGLVGFIALVALMPWFMPWMGQSQTATGIVTSIDDSSSEEGLCEPTVEFVVGSKTYTAVPSVRASGCPWSLGGSATVRYDPGDPSDADVLMGGLDSWIALMIPGVLIAGAGVWCLLAVSSFAVRFMKH